MIYSESNGLARGWFPQGRTDLGQRRRREGDARCSLSAGRPRMMHPPKRGRREVIAAPGGACRLVAGSGMTSGRTPTAALGRAGERSSSGPPPCRRRKVGSAAPRERATCRAGHGCTAGLPCPLEPPPSRSVPSRSCVAPWRTRSITLPRVPATPMPLWPCHSPGPRAPPPLMIETSGSAPMTRIGFPQTDSPAHLCRTVVASFLDITVGRGLRRKSHGDLPSAVAPPQRAYPVRASARTAQAEPVHDRAHEASVRRLGFGLDPQPGGRRGRSGHGARPSRARSWVPDHRADVRPAYFNAAIVNQRCTGKTCFRAGLSAPSATGSIPALHRACATRSRCRGSGPKSARRPFDAARMRWAMSTDCGRIGLDRPQRHDPLPQCRWMCRVAVTRQRGQCPAGPASGDLWHEARGCRHLASGTEDGSLTRDHGHAACILGCSSRAGSVWPTAPWDAGDVERRRRRSAPTDRWGNAQSRGRRVREKGWPLPVMRAQGSRLDKTQQFYQE